MSSEQSETRRRKVFDKHLLGLVLGETELDEAREALGEPADVLEEERVLVLEYESPRETSIATWQKLQLIFFDELLMNVTYSEPPADFTRAALHKVLGQPDESGDDEEDGPSDVFEVALDEDPLLSFVAHYAAGEKVEALSLCADLADDDDDSVDGEDGAGEDGDGDLPEEEDDDAGEAGDEKDPQGR